VCSGERDHTDSNCRSIVATPESIVVDMQGAAPNTGSRVAVEPSASGCASLRERVAAYVARVGIVASADDFGVSRPTLERALGGLRVIRAIEKQIVSVLDRDDRARALANSKGPSADV
jgi:hypothetical protein